MRRTHAPQQQQQEHQQVCSGRVAHTHWHVSSLSLSLSLTRISQQMLKLLTAAQHHQFLSRLTFFCGSSTCTRGFFKGQSNGKAEKRSAAVGFGVFLDAIQALRRVGPRRPPRGRVMKSCLWLFSFLSVGRGPAYGSVANFCCMFFYGVRIGSQIVLYVERIEVWLTYLTSEA